MFKPFQKKKPAAVVMIGMGKAKDPEAPEPLDAPPGKPAGRALPFERKPPVDPEMEQHEAAESPEYEANEESGASLLADIESIGEQHGLDAPASRAFAADLFGAISEALRRGGDTGDSEGDEPA